ncbi:MAG TPA: (2Fe-2S)-binding protein [Chloroflexota bacterium]
MSEHILRVTVNGQPRSLSVPANRLLVHVLRDDLDLTGTKEGCSVGVCGACSVLIDGALVSACLVPAVLVDGAAITTVEGLAPGPEQLSPLQESFIRHGGFQCGICTPGQLIAATALLREVARPTEAQVRAWMMGNLCRCTGYYQIVDSILAVANGGPMGDGA